MDKTIKYQQVIIDYLESVMPEQTKDDGVDYQLVCDTERHHYQIQKVG
ncbi:MAG: XisI protein [Saprospirales bacterium]|nr:XisI protein [Saprospirales bacterium]